MAGLHILIYFLYSLTQCLILCMCKNNFVNSVNDTVVKRAGAKQFELGDQVRVLLVQQVINLPSNVRRIDGDVNVES